MNIGGTRPEIASTDVLRTDLSWNYSDINTKKQ